MTDLHRKEIETVRQWERGLILSILEADQVEHEAATPLTNLKSQVILQSAFHVIETLLPVAYHDPAPSSVPYTAFHGAVRKRLYSSFVMAIEADNDFLAARKIMIQAIQELDIEQERNLLFLLQFRASDIWDTNLFTVHDAIPEITFPTDDAPGIQKGYDHEQRR